MKETKYTHVGQYEFTGPVDATDPCYGKDVWCRINDIPLVPDNYDCWVKMSDEGSWGQRVAELIITPAQVITEPERMWSNYTELEYAGEVGVDAGLAGIFQDKPDFADSEWSEFCDTVSKGNAWILDWGVCCSSGYGDGGYPLFCFMDDNEDIHGLRIVFIDDSE